MARQSSALVGREAELDQLLDVLGRATTSGSGAVLLGGDAGVGKSRLVAEIATRGEQAGLTVLIGHCVNLPDGMLPYVPFVDAFRGLDSDAWQRLEPYLRGGDRTGEHFGQLQMYEAVVALLAELAAHNPVCLILEDLHWADRPSRELIGYLLNRLRDERVALMLTYRTDDVHRRHPLHQFLAEITRHPLVQRISLEPLPDKDITALLSCGGERPLTAAEVADIVDRAEGNAFFAEELRESRLSAGHRERLPSGLADVLVARLDLLDADAQRVVGFAAVAGRRVDHELLAAVTGLPPAQLDDALRAAIARHILVPTESGAAEDGYEFRHALLQEAAYADLLPGERVRIHAAYAALFDGRREQQPAAAAETAHHAELSHHLRLALAASVQAAGYARSVMAPSEALRHLERALQWWSVVPDAEALTGTPEGAMHFRAAEAASAAGDPPRAVSLLEKAARLTDRAADPKLLARIQSRLALELSHTGHDDQSVAASELAIEIAHRLPTSPERAEVYAMHGSILLANGDVSGKAAAEIGLAEARASGAIGPESTALIALSRVAERAGDADTAAAHLTRALELAGASGDVVAEIRTLYNLAMSRYDAGDLAGTLKWTAAGLDRARATGTTWSTYARESMGLDIIARYVTGDWDNSLDRVAMATERAPRNAKMIFQAFGLYTAVARGLPDVAGRLDRAKEQHHPDRYEDAQIQMLISGGRIDHLSWQGEPAAAVQTYHDEVDLPARAWGEYYMGRIWLGALALAALADLAGTAAEAAVPALREAGDRIIGDIRETAKFGVPRAGRMGLEGRAWLARAEAEWSRLLGENDAVVWQNAVAAFEYGHVYEVARGRWRLAEVLIRGGAVDRAEAPLAAAIEAAGKLGARPLLLAAQSLARRAKVGSEARPAASSGSPLTPREQEVLTQLAEGSSNRQIGAALFISEKTASVHVSNILAKLEAGSRGAAVAIARRQRLL